MSRQTIDFGIDLGTTNSCIAVLKGTQTEVIKNRNSPSYLTPSAVAIDKKGTLLIGDAAKNQLQNAKPESLVLTEFKRLMGTAHRYDMAPHLAMRPEDLSAEILKSLRADVKKAFNEEMISAVVTIPAVFDNPECEATKQAALLAGLQAPPLLQEPVAASLAWGFQAMNEDAFWLVYDLGGGTFDAAIMRVRDGIIQVVDHAGDRKLGGKDIDNVLLKNLVLPRIAKEFSHLKIVWDDPKWRFLKSRAWYATEACKHVLSDKESETLNLEFREAGDSGRDLEFSMDLDRSSVENAARPVIARSITICRELLHASGLTSDKIAKVLMVGGPTQMPCLRDWLADPREGLGIPLDFSVDPMTAVARGAAIFAGNQLLSKKLGAAPGTAAYRLEAEYNPVGSDREVLIGGKVASPSGGNAADLRIEFDNPLIPGGWSSGRVPLDRDGRFFTTLLAEPGVRNEFRITLYDSAGRTLSVDPAVLPYTVGLSIEQIPLTASVGIALRDGSVDWLVPKGSPLPRKLTRTGYCVENLADLPEMALVIPVVQGENARADRNEQIGKIEARHSDFPRPLPVGTEVEITLEIEEDQTYRLEAYVPVYDWTGDRMWHPGRPTVDLPARAHEFRRELDRLEHLRTQARQGGNRKIEAILSRIDTERLKESIENLLKIAKSDPDALAKLPHTLLQMQLILDEAEDYLAWPVLKEEAAEALNWCAQQVEALGTPDEHHRFSQLKTDLGKAIEERQADVVKSKVKDFKDLSLQICYRDPQFWIYWLGRFEEERTNFKDSALGAKLLSQAHRAIQDDDTDLLKGAVRQLANQLPESKQSEISKAFGSNLVRINS